MNIKSKTKIKICGITTPDDIVAVKLYRPEYCGFVFWKPSLKRFISPDRAKSLISLLPGDIRSVGVFLDEPLDSLVQTAAASGVDIIQLHGSENDDFIKTVRDVTGKPVIKAFRIGDAADLRRAEASAADMIMLDSGAGTGRVFDWEVLKYSERDYFLAGGLTPINCADAVRTLHPYALDVSSGVERDRAPADSSEGMSGKDPDKIRTFIRNTREA